MKTITLEKYFNQQKNSSSDLLHKKVIWTYDSKFYFISDIENSTDLPQDIFITKTPKGKSGYFVNKDELLIKV